MKPTATLIRLFDVLVAKRVTIVRSWSGLNPIAPIRSRYDLMRDEQGALTGSGYLSNAIIAERLVPVMIAPETTDAFLAALGSTVLTRGFYKPTCTHTDDFPELTVTLSSEAEKPIKDDDCVVMRTESQGTYHAPWAVRVFGDEYIALGEEIGRALLAIDDELGEDSLRVMRTPYSVEAAREAHCWFGVDRVSGDPETTAWKRRARFRQGCWRLANQYPMGTEPYCGGSDAVSVGSRLEHQFARSTNANFITPEALAAALARVQAPEPHQMLREDRLWTDLLSSMPLCFNLFGGLASDPELASQALSRWWPELSLGQVKVRFEHSPGRCDPAFLGNKSAFDVAFESKGQNGLTVIGVEVKYHEHAVKEKPPTPKAMERYLEVTERAGIFREDWRSKVVGTHLQQMWLDHLLLLSMLQHPSRRWSSGRFVLAYPSCNPSFRAAAGNYRDLLRDTSTFEARTLEELVKTHPASATAIAFAERYLAFVDA